VELGLVPLGSIGLTIFGVDLYFTQSQLTADTELRSIWQFLADPYGWRVVIDFIGIGISGGLYIVPLYAFIQQRTPAENRARTIAAINILNALFVVGAAGFGMVVLGVFDTSIPVFFVLIALLNGIVAIAIYRTVPEFAMRFLVWLISHTLYRVRHIDLHNIPEEGPAVLVCNHVSYMDALIIAGACRRPVRFVMFKPIYELPILNFIFRTGKAIPIHSKTADPDAYQRAFDRISEELSAGEVVCIFPEGRLTTDGDMAPFKTGIEKIIARNPVPVVPLALSGLWGSLFSHYNGKALSKLPKRFWSRVTLISGAAIAPEHVSAVALQAQVRQLYQQIQVEPKPR
jgi:1-acyl-sn-glycerol-3-phosphate acyltransferase